MDTIVIKLNQSDKAKMLVELLKSLDFITTVQYFDKYKKAKVLFDEINEIAKDSPLSQLSAEEINEEIKGYRDGK